MKPCFVLFGVDFEGDSPTASVLVSGILPRGIDLASEQIIIPSVLQFAGRNDVVVKSPKVFDVLKLVDSFEFVLPVVFTEGRTRLFLGVPLERLVKVPRPTRLQRVHELGLGGIERLCDRGGRRR